MLSLKDKLKLDLLSIIILGSILFRFCIIFLDYVNDYKLAITTGGDLIGTVEAMKTQADIDFLGTIKKMYYFNFYYIILMIFFKIVIIKNFFTACILSFLSWLVSLYFFQKILVYLKIDAKIRIIITFLFCFWPSLLLYTVYPFKENFQVLFIILVIYYFIKSYYGPNLKNFLLLLFSSFLVGMIHKGLTLYALIIFTYAIIFFYMKMSVNLKSILSLFFLIIFLIIFFYSYNSFGYEQLQRGFFKGIEQYQNGLSITQTRAVYNLYPINIHDIADFIEFTLLNFKNYFLRPYINEIYNILDALVFLENYSRIFIFLFAFYFFIKKKNIIWVHVFIIMIGIEFVWSYGTANWGNSIRHHSVVLPILLILLSIPFNKLSNAR
jgi:hypothetical protein